MEEFPLVILEELLEPTENTLNIQNEDMFESGKTNNLEVIVVNPVSCDPVIVLEDSDDETIETNKMNSNSMKEYVLDDVDVDRMDLQQELDPEFQPEVNFNQIFIGNLPLSVKMVCLVKFFATYGQITDVKFICSRSGRKNICFLTYADSRYLQSALETNGLYYRQHNFRVALVGRLQGDPCLTMLVTDLRAGTTNQNLYDVFEKCGPIKSQYLVEEEGQWLAYITFEFTESLTYALLLRSFIVKGRQIVVSRFVNHPEREHMGLSNNVL